MSAKMSGAIPKTKFESGKGGTCKPGKDRMDEEYPPLESRTVDSKSDAAIITKVPALSKRWVPSSAVKWVEFHLPECDRLSNKVELEENIVSEWASYMELLIDDLRWLLQLPHHEFWSMMIFCPPISQDVLHSFLKSAPRFYDQCYSKYERHPVIWPIYKDIYVLVFRVYMRLATYKESKEDHITPVHWANLLQEHKLITLPVLMSLSTLYESKDNPVFQKMVENIMKNNSRLIEEMKSEIHVLSQKFDALSYETETLSNMDTKTWNIHKFEDILSFKLDAIYSVYKFLKAYPPATRTYLQFPNFVSSMAVSYEVNTRRWGKIVGYIPNLEDRVSLCRSAILRLYRTVLATPTILAIESANDKRLDEFFEYFSNCIDEKIFIHDYEKSFPFRNDMQSLLSRGIFVDETRIDYMANAISACFHSCGEEYSVEKIVVDPMYDPNFDRQLLGACSLEVTGVELESLITKVKDLLSDLPNSYVEAVLKHYGYNTETTINAILENTVPARLEKYKSEDYLKSQSTQCLTNEPDDPLQDKLPVPLPDGLPKENEPTFHAGRRFRTPEKDVKMLDEMDVLNEEAKADILRSIYSEDSSSAKVKGKKLINNSDEMADNRTNAYIDESLLPTYNETVDYEDEYDDTYDDVGAGMTEPDNTLFNLLNVRKIEEDRNSPEDMQEQPQSEHNRNFDAFCEDPAILRAKHERRREEMNNRRGGNHNQQQHQQANSHDVVGRAKGQGQEKDVVYNRRQKTANKGGGGSYKKRSDFKRKEF